MKKKAPASQPARRTPGKTGGPAAADVPSLNGVWMNKIDLERLQDHLREAQETLEAIRNGDVDAVVVSGAHGSQVYSLSGAEEPYRIYVEQMQEGAVTVAADGLVLYCNQRFADMTGTPLEKVISSRLAGHISDPAWQEVSQVFQLDGEAVKHECQLHHAEGGFRYVSLTASRLPLEGQDVMCLVVTDQTERKEREELLLGKEGAEKANLAKDAFLAALSHELRTPLTPALMATMALEQDASLPESVRSTLGMIRRNVELEARLIDDLLDLTRIVQGKLELHSREVDLHSIILRAIEICETDIHSKQQQLEVTLKAAHHLISADPVRLQQALWNVIRNAVKFTPPNGRICIATENTGAKTVRISVRDSGVGFSPDTQKDMFKPFEQGGREITRRFGGLGLGLAISHSIMEAHSGSIQGLSEGHGQGAEFVLELPVKKAPPPAVTPDPSAQLQVAADKGLRILLIEDHADTRNNMSLLLRRSGHEVTPAETAAEGLARAEAATFDLVISDLGLPDMSGLDLMRQPREAYGLKGIAVSGYGMEEDIRRSYDAGFVNHLTKPIHMERLRQVIRHCSTG